MRKLTDERGLAGKILVGVVAWALGAVLMLTSTLISAQQIDNRVARITSEVSPIDKNLDSVELAVETNKIAQQILTAAKPLSGGIDQITKASASIDTSAKSIDSTVASIGTTVGSIDKNANEINGNVLAINGTARAINTTAKEINASVKSIDRSVASINGTVHGINTNLAEILNVARSIRGDHQAPASGFGDGVAAINRRADAVIALVQGIKSDTANILADVIKIDTSAKNIDRKVTGPGSLLSGGPLLSVPGLQ
jgi:prefoldin subunit 5